SEEPRDPAGLHLERQVLDGGHIPEAFRETSHRDRWRSHANTTHPGAFVIRPFHAGLHTFPPSLALPVERNAKEGGAPGRRPRVPFTCHPVGGGDDRALEDERSG